MVVLIEEQWKEGVRSLYYHPHRKLCTDRDEPDGECVRIPVNDDMLGKAFEYV